MISDLFLSWASTAEINDQLYFGTTFLSWASTAEINDQLYFGPRLLVHQLILDTFMACTSTVSSISWCACTAIWAANHISLNLELADLVSVTSTCNTWLICFKWSSPINSCTRFWFYLVLNLPLLIVCVKASQEFLNNECPPWSAMQTGVLCHWLFYIVLNLQLLILHVKVLQKSLNNEYRIVSDEINWSTASAMMRTVPWSVQESLEVWRITKRKI